MTDYLQIAAHPVSQQAQQHERAQNARGENPQTLFLSDLCGENPPTPAPTYQIRLSRSAGRKTQIPAKIIATASGLTRASYRSLNLTSLQFPMSNDRAEFMGLEIFYDLHAPASWDQSTVRRTVTAARQHALTLGFHEVNKLEANDPSHPRTMGVRRLPKDLPYLAAKAEAGWFFRTWPGEGCETALFGLCKFPARVLVEGRSIAFGWGNGWHFHSWCKTQYADLVSRAHFLKCHLGIISILDFFQAEGCRVRVRDGGDFWKSRRVERLTDHLEQMHAIVAAVAGVVKDASESSAGHVVVAPIARHPQFERLEATGHVLLAQKRPRKHSQQK